uniref:Uncharacterized protein n=1 Tax=Oryza glumipatula TaxID=40148 RepID=A0A0E0A943_9ORYZ
MKPRCCWDFAKWGKHDEHTSCEARENSAACGACNEWCQSACRGGECKFRRNHQCCHCYC